MAKQRKNLTETRKHKKDPRRTAPIRRAADHIIRHAKRKDDVKRERGPRSLVSDSVEQAISDMVQTSSEVIEDQIRAGQAAAERLRHGLANSDQLKSDVNTLLEHLLATTRDVGSTWLELMSIIVQSLGAKPPQGGGGSTPHTPPPGSGTVTQEGKSSGAVTNSTFTPGQADIVGKPPQIVVQGKRVTSVSLNLHPSTPGFAPLAQPLSTKDQQYSLNSVEFTTSSSRPPRFVLTITVPVSQPGGTYTGAVVDSSNGEGGGTLSVTIAG